MSASQVQGPVERNTASDERLITRVGDIVVYTTVLIGYVLNSDEDEETVWIADDRSAAKQAEAALRDSEERYRIVAETATDAIITIDKRSTILYANAATETIFGHAAADLIGQELTMLMPDYLGTLHKTALHRYVETGKKHMSWRGIEIVGRCKDGHDVPLEISFGEYRRDDKHLFTGIVRDITERKRVEDSMRWAATIVESANDAVMGTTLDGTGFRSGHPPAYCLLVAFGEGELRVGAGRVAERTRLAELQRVVIRRSYLSALIACASRLL